MKVDPSKTRNNHGPSLPLCTTANRVARRTGSVVHSPDMRRAGWFVVLVLLLSLPTTDASESGVAQASARRSYTNARRTAKALYTMDWEAFRALQAKAASDDSGYTQARVDALIEITPHMPISVDGLCSNDGHLFGHVNMLTTRLSYAFDIDCALATNEAYTPVPTFDGYVMGACTWACQVGDGAFELDDGAGPSENSVFTLESGAVLVTAQTMPLYAPADLARSDAEVASASFFLDVASRRWGSFAWLRTQPSVLTQRTGKHVTDALSSAVRDSAFGSIPVPTFDDVHSPIAKLVLAEPSCVDWPAVLDKAMVDGHAVFARDCWDGASVARFQGEAGDDLLIDFAGEMVGQQAPLDRCGDTGHEPARSLRRVLTQKRMLAVLERDPTSIEPLDACQRELSGNQTARAHLRERLVDALRTAWLGVPAALVGMLRPAPARQACPILNKLIGDAWLWRSDGGHTSNLHWDDVDLMIVVLDGVKTFHLYDPRPETPGDQRAKIVLLRPGDTLFLPRGWWHQVHTPTSARSLSISFAINVPWTWGALRARNAYNLPLGPYGDARYTDACHATRAPRHGSHDNHTVTTDTTDTTKAAEGPWKDWDSGGMEGLKNTQRIYSTLFADDQRPLHWKF